MRKFNWIKWVVIAMFIVIPIMVVYDLVSMSANHCQETGVQRFGNGVNGVYVENQYKCDGGKIKWSY